MTSTPGQPVPRTLTRIAAACFVAGLLVSGFFVWRVVENVPASPVPIERGAVRLEKEGLTIYSSQPVLRPPCAAKDANGADIPLERPAGSETITYRGRTWYVVARSAEPVPPQTVVVSCTDDETNATYYAGPRMSVTAMVVAVFGAIGSFLLFLLAGVVLVIVDTTRRRRRNHPGPTFPGGPHHPGGPQYPGGGPQFPGGGPQYPGGPPRR